MSDVNNIIDNILSDKKLLKSSAFRDKVYKDEPIIITADKLIKNNTPLEIKEMKDIAFSQAAYWKTSAWLFYTQGKFMESYTDNYSYNEDFVKYYPCYRELNVEQLRGYFSWRTQVRIGNTTKAPLPFVFIYIYELINCIGAETPEECFTLLRDFCRGYKDIDDTISRYVDNWLIDFIVYNELDTSLAKDIPEVIYEDYMLILLHWKRHNENEIFSAVSYLSTYQPEKSLFFISCQEDFKNVTVRCIVKLSEFFAEKRKSSLFSRLFGNISECSHNMFSSAIFYDRQPLRNCEYKLNELHTFSCKNGRWSCCKISGSRSRNGRLGDIIKAIDSLLRDYNNFRHKISFDGISKSAIKVIQTEIELYYAEKLRKETVRIEIDLSKLDSIRKASDLTREKLLVDNEEEEEKEIMTIPAENSETDTISALPLDKDETIFLKALLYNGNPAEAARKCGKLLSILADSINEKLFNSFGDTVIDFSDDFPVLIEDYIDEIKAMIPKE